MKAGSCEVPGHSHPGWFPVEERPFVYGQPLWQARRLTAGLRHWQFTSQASVCVCVCARALTDYNEHLSSGFGLEVCASADFARCAFVSDPVKRRRFPSWIRLQLTRVPRPVLSCPVLSWQKNPLMADLASEYLRRSEGSPNMSSLFSLKEFYFQRVEDVPEYVQQVSACTFSALSPAAHACF